MMLILIALKHSTLIILIQMVYFHFLSILLTYICISNNDFLNFLIFYLFIFYIAKYQFLFANFKQESYFCKIE